MAITIGSTAGRIGLALSGGGFRAAAFHLGVFRKLRELGLLDKLDVISCVSGGSIAGGFLVANWGQDSTLDRLESYLRTKSVAVSSVLGGIVDPFHTRLEKLAKSYDRDLFHGRKLGELANCPRLYLNSTNLATGNMFSFVAGGGGEAELGEWELGFGKAGEVPISHAVAASSAFPPVFPPLLIEEDRYRPAPEKGVEYVTLTDGGIYDNMGVNPLLNSLTKLSYMIVSDAGKPFDMDERPTESGALVLKASIDIMMEQIRGLEFDRMKHRHLAGMGPKPLWFSIDSALGEAQSGDALQASRVGTNLKRLSAAELTVLQRHGGALVEARLRKYAAAFFAKG